MTKSVYRQIIHSYINEHDLQDILVWTTHCSHVWNPIIEPYWQKLWINNDYIFCEMRPFGENLPWVYFTQVPAPLQGCSNWKVKWIGAHSGGLSRACSCIIRLHTCLSCQSTFPKLHSWVQDTGDLEDMEFSAKRWCSSKLWQVKGQWQAWRRKLCTCRSLMQPVSDSASAEKVTPLRWWLTCGPLLVALAKLFGKGHVRPGHLEDWFICAFKSMSACIR